VAEERDLVIRTVPFGPDGYLDGERLAAAIGARTRVVAVTAAANAIGSVVDVPAVSASARAVGALVYVDAVHAAPHIRIDVAALGCDALVCSPYKFYGPHAGVLWARKELLADLHPPRLAPAPADGPSAWESGTPAYEAIAGTTAAIDWLASLAAPDASAPGTGLESAPARPARLNATFAALHERGRDLTARLWNGLAAREGVRLYGPVAGGSRTPTIAFSVRGTEPAGVARHLADRYGVFVSHGNFYAPDVLTDLGVDQPGGLIRAGCACYTTGEEVDRLVDGVA
jgi:selenocysteine lyase/cysteine desulfurase